MSNFNTNRLVLGMIFERKDRPKGRNIGYENHLLTPNLCRRGDEFVDS